MVTMRHEDKNEEAGEGEQNAKSLRSDSRAHFREEGKKGMKDKRGGEALPIGSIIKNGCGTVRPVAADKSTGQPGASSRAQHHFTQTPISNISHVDARIGTTSGKNCSSCRLNRPKDCVDINGDIDSEREGGYSHIRETKTKRSSERNGDTLTPYEIRLYRDAAKADQAREKGGAY